MHGRLTKTLRSYTTLLPFSFRCGDPESWLGAQGCRQGPSEGGSRRLPLASLSSQLRKCPRAHKAGPNPDLMQDSPRGAPTGPQRGACAPRKAVPCLPGLERLPGNTFFPAFRNLLALSRKYTLYVYFFICKNINTHTYSDVSLETVMPAR